MCTFRVFGTLFWFFRADSENNLTFEHIFQKVTMWTYFSKWLIMAMFCAVFSFASPFPTCAQTYTPKSALLASMWLGLKPSWPIVTFTTCLLKDDMGTDDVTDMQLLICAKYPHTPYIALPWFTSIKELSTNCSWLTSNSWWLSTNFSWLTRHFEGLSTNCSWLTRHF